MPKVIWFCLGIVVCAIVLGFVLARASRRIQAQGAGAAVFIGGATVSDGGGGLGGAGGCDGGGGGGAC